ncbi:N-acetyl-D-Glu racemase DgcA [Ahrensia marina]|uniref:N-acetyl-D-Glu racemase DgcA n=1 Tax=Ahrensia marina TaxID=1514904 RepID=UPI0035D06503
MISLHIDDDAFRIRGLFSIARGSRTHAHVVTVTLKDGEHVGRGECTPYARYDESVESVTAQIEALRDRLEQGLTREALQELLPAGAARNAVDCALWDLEAKRTGKPVHELARVPAVQPLETAYTISLDTPDEMARVAYDHRNRPLLKVKLGGDGDPDRMRAVCGHAGDAKVIVDANEAWAPENLWTWMDLAAELGIALVEQPLPAGKDAILADRPHTVPICADESAHDREGLSHLARLYDVINIKLDKTGGLTEALALKAEAKAAGLGIFVGCMMGSSLAMAPGTLLAHDADYVDLDAPLLLAEDRDPALQFNGSILQPPSHALWG